MADRVALDPENRALYGEILRAPVGYELDVALATTYTLDFETALVIPAMLAFHAAESRKETLDTPLALLEGLERLSANIAIFCEAGRIKAVPKQANRLTALLEDTVTEVLAPRGGAFHPKIWALRFAPVDGRGKARLRLALLSRNLTTDNSWDISLCLDGAPGDTPQPENAPLVELLLALPGMAVNRPTPDRAAQIAEQIAEDLASAIWEHPEHVRRITFAVNGLTDEVWKPRIGTSLGVMSPFVTDGALSALSRRIPSEKASLLGRSEELASLKPETLARFGQVLVMDEMAETEDGEDTPDSAHGGAPARGLHAKAIITERYSSTEITVGSGNATSAALLSGENVEVFATISGYSRHLGTVEEQFSPERLGRYLRDFTPFTPPDDTAEKAAEERLDAVRRNLIEAGLCLHCEEDEGGRFALGLSSSTDIHVPAFIDTRIWPIVTGSANGVDVRYLREQPTRLGSIALRDVTRWIGVCLSDGETGQEQIFTLGTELVGLPETRTAEILRSIIENREAFLRYIRLLLGDVSEAAKALFAAGTGGDFGAIFGNAQEAALLEDMVRALSGDGRQLRDIERLVQRLSDLETGQSDVIPNEFLDLWETFRQVLPEEVPNG